MDEELDILQDTTQEGALFADTTAQADSEETVDNARYNDEGERLYYWVPPSELGDPKRTSEEAELYKDTGGYYTEAEIRAAWDAEQGMGYLKEQTDWENYWGYLTERQDLIDDGVLSDGTSVTQAQRQAKKEAIQAAGGLKASGGAKGAGKGTEQITLAARQDAFNNMINDPAQVELMEKYGLSMSFQNDDGDTFRWNGSSYTKTDKVAGPNWGLLIGAAMTGYIMGPQIAGAAGFSGGVAGGAASSAAGSIISQGIATGSVDFGQVATAGVLGGIGGFFDDLQAATPGTYGGWVVNGEVVGTAGTWGIEKGQYLADLLNIPLDQALGIMEGVLTGAVSGEDLEGIAINAVAGWGEAYTNQWVKDTLGDQGLDVDNLFKEGTTNISTESLQGLVSEGFDALVAGGMSETDALKAIYGFFDEGGSLDFLLPMLPELGFEGDLFDIPNFCESFPKLCNVNITNPCPDGFIDNGDGKGCVPNPCPDGFIDNGDGKGCVQIPEVSTKCPDGWDRDEDGICIEPPELCGDGFSWDPQLGECIETTGGPDICPDGFIDNGDGKGCVEIPKVNITNPCPEGFIDNGDGKGCVPNPCPEGFIDNGDGKGCVEIPEVNISNPCPDGFIDNGDGKGCVEIPKIPCPEGFRNENGKCLKIEGPDIDIDLNFPGLGGGGGGGGSNSTPPTGLLTGITADPQLLSKVDFPTVDYLFGPFGAYNKDTPT